MVVKVSKLFSYYLMSCLLHYIVSSMPLPLFDTPIYLTPQVHLWCFDTQFYYLYSQRLQELLERTKLKISCEMWESESCVLTSVSESPVIDWPVLLKWAIYHRYWILHLFNQYFQFILWTIYYIGVGTTNWTATSFLQSQIHRPVFWYPS